MMKLTYSEQKYSRLRKILSKHVGQKNAEFLTRLTKRAEKDIKEVIGNMLDPQRQIIIVGRALGRYYCTRTKNDAGRHA